MFDINQLFASSALQRYYDEQGNIGYYTLPDILGKLKDGAVPKKLLASDPALRPETLEAALLAHRGMNDQFDRWLVGQLEVPRHNLKILLDTNIPETFYPYIEDRFGSFDLAPKGTNKRADAWGKQPDYDLVIIRNRGQANRPSPQFVKAANPDQLIDYVDKAPVVVLCTHTAQEDELRQIFERLDHVIRQGHITDNLAEMRLNTAGFIAFHHGVKEPTIELFPKRVAAAQPNHDNFRQPA
ncbi:MAG: hypothetical protein WC043_06355 [Pseudobdellovibrionaceae bacterium]